MADTKDISPDFPLPPASFGFLVESIMMQTQMQLGIFSMGEEEDDAEVEPNLPIASHSIEVLAMLKEKTQGNLTMEEQRIIENGLTELRFQFVQVSEELKRQAQVQSGSSPAEQPLIISAGGGKGSKTE